MRKYILLLASLFPLLVFAQKPFVLTAQIGKKGAVKAYMSYWNNAKSQLDSAVIKNGSFFFKGKISDASRALIWVRYRGDDPHKKAEDAFFWHSQYMNNDESISAKKEDILLLYVQAGNAYVKSADSVCQATVTGMRVNQDFRDLSSKTGRSFFARRKIQNIMKSPGIHAKDTAWFKVKEDSVNQYSREINEIEKEFIELHPNSDYALLAVKEGMPQRYKPDSILNIVAGFSPRIKSGVNAKSLVTFLERERRKSPGARFPDIADLDINGKLFKFSSLKGKYVLVDFWASWCKPCRAQNPYLVKAYAAFKDKGFDMVSVSLDTDEQAWKEAVNKDGLKWTQVADLKGAGDVIAKYFNIKGLPSNMLIDPNGVIVHWGIPGEDLEAMLTKLMKLE